MSAEAVRALDRVVGPALRPGGRPARRRRDG